MKGRMLIMKGRIYNYVGVYIYNNVNSSVGRPKVAFPPST